MKIKFWELNDYIDGHKYYLFVDDEPFDSLEGFLDELWERLEGIEDIEQLTYGAAELLKSDWSEVKK